MSNEVETSQWDESREPELVCHTCKRIHSVNVLDPKVLVPHPADKAYSFSCSHCLSSGVPSLLHSPKSWLEFLLTVLYNLMRTHKEKQPFPLADITTVSQRWCGSLHPPEKTINTALILSTLRASPHLFGQPKKDTWVLRPFSDDDEAPSGRRAMRHLENSSKNSERSKQRVPKLFQWCHQCKQKHDNVLNCSQDCNKKYCAKCLERHYHEKEADIDRDRWVCIYCRQLCCCAFCRKKKAKATNTKFESRRGKKRNLSRRSKNGSKRRKKTDPFGNPNKGSTDDVFSDASSHDDSADSESSMSEDDSEVSMDTEQSTEYMVTESPRDELLVSPKAGRVSERVVSRNRSLSPPTIQRSLPIKTEPADVSDCDSDEDVDNGSVPVPQLRFQSLRIADHYTWLKYELQHSPEDIHGTPFFDDKLIALREKDELGDSMATSFFLSGDFPASFRDDPIQDGQALEHKIDDRDLKLREDSLWADSVFVF